MSQSLCERFGFDSVSILERLRLTGLDAPDSHSLAATLQDHVVRPGLDSIIDSFYREMSQEPRFLAVVREHTQLSSLRTTQCRYLLSLGVDFDTIEYFEERLHVGAVHQRVGVSLPLYQCAYRLLQSLLIRHIPVTLKADPAAHEALVQFILKMTSLDMSLAIETYYSSAVSGLEQSIDTIRIEGETLRRSLRTDSLTALGSREYSIQTLKNALSVALAAHQPLSVIMADLDHFKQVNDRYGHLVGDRVLQAVASRLTQGARERDTIGRYGGEEFLFILDHTTLEDAATLAERVRQRVAADPIHVDGHDLHVTISLGVAEARPEDDTRTLLSRADHALYAAKKSGRNRVALERARHNEAAVVDKHG
ncbi:MAG: diguanylate cyclase [Gammaproteobacteria bacterium]|nr:diguanylate cyclase [Gammaproteobacteria bacterium]MDH4256151.1 diguanylate cyclase [Gammaproteobacteria bacterium]MDH5311255.1 diguanylate cyclase [Gammaproteobacteria bacterium]